MGNLINILEIPMKQFVIAIFTLSLALPVQAQTAVLLTEDELIGMANARPFCEVGKTAIAARYASVTDNVVEITCEDDATGFVPLAAAGLGLGGGATAAAAIAGLGVAALASGGGGGATPDTQSQ